MITSSKQRFFIPEVIQSSMMDCGPAALKAVVEGFGGQISYGRLREACNTDVDGTSIETLEALAVELGLEASQLLVPEDHLLIPQAQALPALAVVMQPNGMTHFIVIWAVVAGWAQIMDPGSGRHWVKLQTLKDRLYRHQHEVEIDDWLAWASSTDFTDILKLRMLKVCNDQHWAQSCIEQAINDNNWLTLAHLDAATRMISAIIRSGGINAGEKAGLLLNHFMQNPELITANYYLVQANPDNNDTLCLSGAVIIHFADFDSQQATLPEQQNSTSQVEAIKNQDQPKPEQHILRALKADGPLHPWILTLAILLTSFGLAVEIIVLRGVVEISQQAQFASQRLDIYLLMLLFFFALLLLEWPLAIISRSFGRRVEVRLRKAFLEKMPKLEDRYFHSRLTSDMIQRAYELRQLRNIPVLGFNIVRSVLQIVFVTIGLAIIFPQGAWQIAIGSIMILACSFLAQPLLLERDMRFRTHVGGLSRFYLDTLLGLVPIRAHSASNAIRTDHEKLLIDWVKSGWRFFSSYELFVLFNFLVSTGFTVWVVFAYLETGGDGSGLLVLLYWMLYLPQLGTMLAENLQQYPSLRNRMIRMLEPLSAPDESSDWYPQDESQPSDDDKTPTPAIPATNSSVKIQLENVSLDLAGQRVLSDWHVTVNPAEHIAIVGQSGAGKSSVMGLLLGWHKPAQGGKVWIDDKLYHGQRIAQLRQATVWVDPQVQIWNQSLTGNINYGNTTDDTINNTINPIILTQSELLSVIDKLPQGLDTKLGENGGLLSGGEGQRVRIARGLNKLLNQQQPRLVILDEPFRGLAKGQRQRLLATLREYFKHTTLLIVTHHVADTQDFERVWVINDGQLVEDASPKALSSNPNSHYSKLLDTQQKVKAQLLDNPLLTKIRISDGKIQRKTPY